MMIDTHTHLYLEEFAEDRNETMERAFMSGVDRMIFPNVDLKTIKPMLELQSRYPGRVFSAMGLHPTEVSDTWRNDILEIERLLFNGKNNFVAVGEIGIDLYWDKSFREEQMDAFRRQVDIAAALKLPVIIHCRDGLDETLQVLSSVKEIPAGVFHSFGGTADDVRRIRSVGDFYFGVNGIVTFKNSKLREVLPEIGLNRILLETDSPYLAPVPKRGRRNESSYLPYIAATVADALGCSVSEAETATTRNAVALFGLPLENH